MMPRSLSLTRLKNQFTKKTFKLTDDSNFLLLGLFCLTLSIFKSKVNFLMAISVCQQVELNIFIIERQSQSVLTLHLHTL